MSTKIRELEWNHGQIKDTAKVIHNLKLTRYAVKISRSKFKSKSIAMSFNYKNYATNSWAPDYVFSFDQYQNVKNDFFLFFNQSFIAISFDLKVDYHLLRYWR